jgi:heme/copper-type cytochrome/quinol oxidase subunit 2
MDRRGRPAISRVVWVFGVITLLAVAAGEYLLAQDTKGASGPSRTIDVAIIETDPILQLDHFFPDNFTLTLGENVTIAVQNGDDELRVFTIQAFNVNFSMPAGTAYRVTFQADKTGTFPFFSPKTPPSPVSQGRPGPRLDGNVTVTQS